MAGSSGFLGTALADRLHADGHEVVRLVRRPARGAGEVTWDPEARHLDAAVLAGADGVVNLSGASINHVWTEVYRKILVTSRVNPTATIAAAITALNPTERPKVLVNGSAVGFYGDTGNLPVDEDATSGGDFLADLCRVWEGATRPVDDAGVRVVRLRTGFPLHRSGGFLAAVLPAFRMGLGPRLGSGRQWLPWISLEDWLSVVTFVLSREDVAGPVNAVGPAPVPNAEFTRDLATAVHRPAFVRIPGPPVRLFLGDLGRTMLASSRVRPGALNRHEFTFRHQTLPAALEAAL